MRVDTGATQSDLAIPANGSSTPVRLLRTRVDHSLTFVSIASHGKARTSSQISLRNVFTT